MSWICRAFRRRRRPTLAAPHPPPSERLKAAERAAVDADRTLKAVQRQEPRVAAAARRMDNLGPAFMAALEEKHP